MKVNIVYAKNYSKVFLNTFQMCPDSYLNISLIVFLIGILEKKTKNYLRSKHLHSEYLKNENNSTRVLRE